MLLRRQNDSKLTRAAARILRRSRRCMSCRSHTARAKPCGLPAEPALPAPPVRDRIRENAWCFRVSTSPPLFSPCCFASPRALPAVAQEPPRPRHADSRRPATAAQAACRRDAAPATATSATTRCRSIGEPKYPAGFTHFDWVNPDAPKGGSHARLRRGLVRQPQPVHGEGRPGGRHRPRLRLAAGLEPRRAVVRVRPHRRVGILSARLFVGDLRPQSEGALPRRLADHARGRHLLVRGAEEGASALRRSTTRTSSRRRRPATTR